jgi:hypothetical protein
MRPQDNRRATRAIAALVAALLAVAAFAGTASARTAPSSRHALAALVTLISRLGALSPPSAHSADATRRTHRPRHHSVAHRLRLQAVMLHHDVLVGQDVAFVGLTRPGAARRLVGVQRRVGPRWVQVARARTDGHGRFLARYWPQTLGHVRLRLRIAGASGPGSTVVEPAATVFHEVVASWYGPGGTTACGESLGAGTLGVANRTLPCGTPVTLRYRDRTLTVPVIDRGPYVAGRDYDLTYATKVALGAGDVTVLWASA